jgi:hypothetical protein
LDQRLHPEVGCPDRLATNWKAESSPQKIVVT